MDIGVIGIPISSVQVDTEHSDVRRDPSFVGMTGELVVDD
jgi:hypothetical protein